MRLLLFFAAICLATPVLARTNLWTEADTKVGETIELKELHVQQCQRRYDCWGLMNASGKITSIPIFRLIGIDDEGQIAARIENSKTKTAVRKLIGPQGQIIPKTDEMEVVNFMMENRAPVRLTLYKQPDARNIAVGTTNLAYSYCTESGEILAARFDQVSQFSEGKAAVRIGKLVGFVDLNVMFLSGSKKVECLFTQGISEGCLAASINGLWGYLDTQGNWLIKPKFSFAGQFQSGLAMVSVDESSGTDGNSKYVSYVDKTGKQISQRFYSGKPFEGAYAAVSVLSNQTNSKPLWGLIDKTGRWAIEPKYTKIGPPINSTRLLYDKELVGIFSNGTFSVEPKYQRIGEFSEGLASFQNPKTKKYGFLDQTGKIIIPATFEFAGTFSEGLAAVRTTSTKDREKSVIGFINRQGAMKIAPNLSATTAENPDFSQNFVQFHEGICFIPNRPYHDGKYVSSGSGYINKSGQWVEHHVITEAYPFKAGQALVRYYPKSGK